MRAPDLVFDGHNDTLLRLWRAAPQAADPGRGFVERSAEGHIDLVRAREGGLGGGLCAIWVPSGRRALELPDPGPDGRYDAPLATSPELGAAQRIALAMLARAYRIERASDGAFRICRTADEIEASLGSGTFAAVLNLEGAEAIDAHLDALEVFHQAGLRSLGPVWSRPNRFGHGVPFRFPSGPDTGPGLTDAGKALVRACDTLGVMVDLSHLTEAGFWDVAAVSDAPLVASHSNAHAIAPMSRNLTDRQLDAIRERGGLVGVNLAVRMLRPDGREDAKTPLDIVVRHFDYLAERVGIDGVAFGSDFDGATVPGDIGDAAGLPRLVAALRRAGWDDAALRKACRENWLRIFRATWKNEPQGISQ